MMRRAFALGLVTVAVATAGCGGGDSGPGPLPKGELVSLTRSGRAPFDDQTIVLRGDGHAIISNRAGFHVIRNESGIVKLVGGELRRSHFSDLRSKEDRIPGPDAYRYAITYHGRTVNWPEGSTPSELKHTVKTLSGYLGGGPRSIDFFLKVHRRGGFAPTDLAIYVSNDGRLDEFETGGRRSAGRYRLAPRALAALRQAVVQLRLVEVRSSSGPHPADGYVYEVTADLSPTIRAVQGSIPPPLQRVIALAQSRTSRTAR